MFNGIILELGMVKDNQASPDGLWHRLEIASSWPDLALGESIAVEGVCLTVVERARSGNFIADVGQETLRCTVLANLKSGQKVNLERSLKVGDRISGHFVQGHVDGLGRICDIRVEGQSQWVTFSYPAALGACIVPKGSIAINGVSLTVASKKADTFAVSLLNFTHKQTSFTNKKIGDIVHLETDILARTLLEQSLPYRQDASFAPDALFVKKNIDWPDIGE